MRDIDLYTRILGIQAPWRVADQICPKGKSLSTWNGKRVHSHVARPVASRRQVTTRAVVAGSVLDTCQYKTILEADVPRVKCH